MNASRSLRAAVAAAVIAAAILSVAGRAAAAIPKKDVWYTQHYVIMQDFEKKAYRKMSEAGRQAFRELFWAVRTADARATFAARLEHVKKNFWKENNQQPWNTDRSRVYLLNGSPASIDVDQNAAWASSGTPSQFLQATDRSNEDVAANRAEVWVYPFEKYFIKYTFTFVQPYSWKIVQGSGNRYLGDLETYNREVTFGVADLEAYKAEIGALVAKKK